MRFTLSWIRPLVLVMAVLLFGLGAGIARYLGSPLSLPAFLLGLFASLMLLTAFFLTSEVFRRDVQPLGRGETARERERGRTRVLQVSYALLSLSGAAVISLLLADLLTLPAGLLLLLILVLLGGWILPPFRLEQRGYGELVLAVVLATLLPAFSYFLQTDEFHRLVPIVCFPLTLLAIAWQLVGDFPSFAADQKSGQGSLLIRLTWPRAIPLHHLLAFFAFLLLAAGPLTGVPWGLIGPVFLAVPFYLAEGLWLHRIGRGGPTRWPFLTALAAGAFGAAIYLLALTFWTR